MSIGLYWKLKKYRFYFVEHWNTEMLQKINPLNKIKLKMFSLCCSAYCEVYAGGCAEMSKQWLYWLVVQW